MLQTERMRSDFRQEDGPKTEHTHHPVDNAQGKAVVSAAYEREMGLKIELK